MKLTELAFFTDEVERMTSFYRRLLGADPVAQSEGMAIFLVGGTKILIHRNYAPSEGDLPPVDHFALGVRDVGSESRRLLDEGLEFEAEAQDYDWGRSAYLRDPDGRQIEIIEAGPEGG